MKKPSILYIPLAILFLFVMTAFVGHYAYIKDRHAQAVATVKVPFRLDGEIVLMRPEAEAAGLKLRDRIVAMNGTIIENNEIYSREVDKLKGGETLTLLVNRPADTPDAPVTRHEVKIPLQFIPQDVNYYAGIVVGFATAYLLPTFCALLGFWVAFLRPRDFLAWLLLFMLLGVSALTFEGFPNNTLLGAYNRIFFNMWALSMMLFGIYFPERLGLDRRVSWLKWILIVPLAFQAIMSWWTVLYAFAGFGVPYFLQEIAQAYGRILIQVNMVAISIFFASLGYKAWAIKSPDSRRRLRLIMIGSTVALLPSFSIVLYRVISGKSGAFSDLVPVWYALFSLFAMLLFPLTLAYVIVVHRAMDVSVVVRQGLQYALAKRGVQVLQVILLIGVIFGTILIIRNFGEDISAQIGFVAAGVALIPLIDFVAKRLRTWIDKKFFREAYNSEQILTELTEDVRTMVETKPLLETVSNKISDAMHVPQVALLLKQGNAFQPAYALGYESTPSVEIAADATTVEKLKKNEPVIVYQDDKENWVNREASAAERDELRELNSQLLLPLGSKDDLSGVISLSPKRSEEPYSPNDLRLLKLVAAQTGMALENSRLTEAIVSEAAQKERLNRELEIAREVQERLFPQDLPPVKGLDYYGACRPALGVGGDYYDFIELPENKFGIAIGDVSGKGIGASLMMASLQASLRGQAIHYKDELAELMKQINTLVYEASTSNRYATFFYGRYAPATRSFTYVNAGHNPPFLLRPTNNQEPPEGGTQDFEVIRLEEGGAVVGMLPPIMINYIYGEVTLQPGDLLVGYTDGISEAMDPADEEWGEDAMLEQLKICYDRPAKDILEFIVERADEFANGAKQHDDMTLIVVKVV